MAPSALAGVVFACALTLSSALQLLPQPTSNGTSDASPEFCIQGYLVPRFFLLGAPKSGTTYFFEDFARTAGLAHYKPSEREPPWHAKEPWVFARKSVFVPDADFHRRIRKEWLSHYPACSEAGGKVAVDCTPGNFGSMYAPENIRISYPEPIRQKLVFMVFLRNPLARTLSHYYHYLENGVLQGRFAPGCSPEQFPPTFEVAVSRVIAGEGHVCNCSCDNMIRDSRYVASFKRYFRRFAPSQFHVVPFGLATDQRIVRYAWDVLGLPAGTGQRSLLVGATNAMNHHSYPALATELGPATLLGFRKFIAQEAGSIRIAALLARTKAHLGKPHLFMYPGPGDNVAGIAHWLEANWGIEGTF